MKYIVICCLSLSILVSCEPKVGSTSWFQNTGDAEIKNYYTLICQDYGFVKLTPQIAECIQKEINAQKERNLIKENNVRATLTGASNNSLGSGISITIRETFK